jgi:WXXGXW repeat (2 copies)
MRFIPSIRSLLFGLVIIAISAASFAQIGISVSFGPPALPVYEQPPCPSAGYLWTPGYWAYSPEGYYWVPGTWVMAPQPGLLWTPPYWGWGGGRFVFYDGYWGPHVGFYGGISYGFGYFGSGYQGGRWDNGQFFYNRSVNNVNVTNIHNVYNTTVINNTTINRVSYNGGNGGVEARPSPEEETAAHERHVAPVAAQTQHIEAARANPELKASANQGRPPIAATARPGEFKGEGAVPAKEAGAPYKAEANRGGEEPKAGGTEARPENNVPRPPAKSGEEPKSESAAARPENNVPRPPATHAKDLQPHPRPPAPNTGNPKTDQKYQQQQDKLYTKQDQDHQKLQQKQEQDHQRLAQRNADAAKNQQVEQRHQQQTQQLEQKHEQQAQRLQTRQQPANHGGGAPKGRP